MDTFTHRRPSLRLGIVVGAESWHFFTEIYRHLCRFYTVSIFDPVGGFDIKNPSLRQDLRTFLQAQDITFFEWSSQLLKLATEARTKCKFVTRLHRYELFTWAETIDWQRVDAAIFVNRSLLEKFQTYWVTQPRRTIVIPPGISTARFHPMGLGLTYRIGTLSWLAPRKRIYELILCFSELCQTNPRLRLSIAGGRHASFPDYYDALLGLVDRLRLGNRVTFFGQPKHVPAWYRTIDLFVSNSYSEGVQVALLEAMSSACYCVSHAWQGAETVLPTGQVYCTDGELQTQILAFYATSRQERYRAQMRMREEACRKYDIKLVQRRILSLIAEVAQS